MPHHLADEELSLLYEGGLDPDQEVAVRAHIEACAACKDLYQQVARRSDAGLDGARAMTRRAPLTAGVFQKGEIIAGKYRVEKMLGRGGMGHVFAARHVELNQLVAVKVLRRDLLDDPDAVKRFSREAKAAAALRGDHALRIFDVGKLESGEPFILMEHLDGYDLSTVLDRGQRIEALDAIDWIIQACEAVAEAHDLGIVHRDIKPHNLFLTRDRSGRAFIKVVDFGLAKAIRADAARSIKDSMSLHSHQAMLGTPFFMSPEQILGATIDHRTDIWSLGATLYHLLAGVPPFMGPTVTMVCAMILNDDFPPLAHRRPDAPHGLDDILRRCMNRDPDRRFNGVMILAESLRQMGRIASQPNIQSTRRLDVALPHPSSGSIKATMPMNALQLQPPQNSRRHAPTVVSQAKQQEQRSSHRVRIALVAMFTVLAIVGIALGVLAITLRRQ